MAEETVETPEVTPDRYADFSDRAWARIIDMGVLSVLALPLWGVYYVIALYGEAPAAVLLAWPFLGYPLYIAYFAIMTARSGQTFGKRLAGIQVQGEDGRPPRAAAAVWRAIIDLVFMKLIILLVGLLDCLWLYRRNDRRTLHDLAVGTRVKIIRPWPNHGGWILIVAVLLMGFTPQNLMLERSFPQDLDNMSPVIRKGDHWVANLLAYRRHSPRLGDVVVFKTKLMLRGSQEVGRIVGLPGEELVLRSGQVERVSAQSAAGRFTDQVTVPTGYVAVLGDNRAMPEEGGYPRLFPPSLPPPPGERAFRPRSPWPNDSASPILVVPSADITGKVIGISAPFWRVRAVR